MLNNLTKDNHYVSQGYLKQWEGSAGKVFAYRLLVSHAKVPAWEEKSTKSIGFQEHLYTQYVAGSESDEIERWFSKEFETPAEGALQKVLGNEQLSPEDWRLLVRYLAMHDVRTPARLAEYLSTIPALTSNSLSGILSQLPTKLAEMKRSGVGPPAPSEENVLFPLRVTTEIKDGEELGTLRAETHVGRASWLWAIRHVLNKTANVLHSHRWTVMRPSNGMSWFTSDKPVIRLNYYGPEKYDFKGGWARNGGEIIFPLGPQHMLYTRIGHRPPTRGSRFSPEQTQLLRRLIAEHAHRYVFAQAEDADLPTLRPRTVDPAIFNSEKEQWEKWHSEQTESERYLFS